MALTDPKITAYSTVTSVDADLILAEEAYDLVQDELMALLESGAATMATVAEVEERAARALALREDLRGTRGFLVGRQRWQAEQDSKGLLYAFVLCKWAVHFTVADVTEYTFNLHAANEMNGVTGSIHIMRGWFATYLEGPPPIIHRLCSEMKANRSQFEVVVIAEKDTIPAPSTRRFANEALRIVHVEDAQTFVQKHPEATVLREIAFMMNLFSFVPELNSANRGKGRFETTKGANLLLKNDPTAGATGEFFHCTKRAVVLVSPIGDFWDMGLLDSDISRIIEKVVELARSFLIDRDQRSFAAGLCGPHTQDGLYIVVESDNIGYTLELLTDFLAELNRDIEIKELYKPLMVVEHSADVGLVINGSCTIVGPIMRQLRKLMTVAKQEGHPFLASYRVADLADRKGCHSVGTFVIDKDPSELFTHVTQLGKDSFKAEVAAIEAKVREAMKEVNEHVEGPGTIEPLENFMVRAASAREKKLLALKIAAEKREATFAAKSGSFNNGKEEPQSSKEFANTSEVMSSYDDPARHASLKSVTSATTKFKGHAVLKDDPSVRPAGSALQAVRSVGSASPARKPADGIAAAGQIVQAAQYFVPKGIQGDAEFKEMYDQLPKTFGGPDNGSYATRRGFELFYHSLEHFGTNPTPAQLDDLIGKSSNPSLVTFEQFCRIMNRYQKM